MTYFAAVPSVRLLLFFLNLQRKLGGRLVTIVVKGDVASVTEAVETAARKAIKKPAASGIIANPHEEILR